MTVTKRGKFYHFEFWVEGQRYCGAFNGKKGLPVAEGKEDAKDKEREVYRKVVNGTYGKEDEREQLKSFTAFVDRIYLPYARKYHSNPKHAEFRTDVLKEFFGDRKLADITAQQVEEYIEVRLGSRTKRNADRSPVTVRKEFGVLAHIFNMAVRKKLLGENPCNEVEEAVLKKIPCRRRRKRFLTLAEEARLYAALADEREHLRPVVTLALLTGMRKGEILDLRWEHVNLGAEVEQHLIKGETWNLRPGWLLVVKTKSGVPRMVPMSTKVCELLSVLREHTDSELVFPSGRTGLRITDIKTGFRTALGRAKLSNFRFHDLRHTWATRAADCHVPEPVRRDIMGHQSETMTGDYTHAMLEAMEEAVELVASYRGRAAAGPAKSRQKLTRREGRPSRLAA